MRRGTTYVDPDRCGVYDSEIPGGERSGTVSNGLADAKKTLGTDLIIWQASTHNPESKPVTPLLFNLRHGSANED
jgi:hypothetical protein